MPLPGFPTGMAHAPSKAELAELVLKELHEFNGPDRWLQHHIKGTNGEPEVEAKF